MQETLKYKFKNFLTQKLNVFNDFNANFIVCDNNMYIKYILILYSSKRRYKNQIDFEYAY